MEKMVQKPWEEKEKPKKKVWIHTRFTNFRQQLIHLWHFDAPLQILTKNTGF